MSRGFTVLMAAIIATGIIATTEGGIPAGSEQAAKPAGVLQKGKAYRFNKIRDDIYHATGTGALNIGSNSVVIINEADVMLVDSHISPAAAWVLQDELKAITNKPVRYVVNSHFHYDHAHGNQVFGKDVEIIGHEFTREVLLNATEGRLYKAYLAGIPAQIDQLKTRLAAETDAARQSQLQTQIEVAEANRLSQAELRPTPPTVTLRDTLTLHRGAREIQLRFFGRGHTGGDVVVFLPKEKIICTGDIVTNGIANMVDGFADEWVKSLESMKALDFDTVLPGHGEAFTGKDKITHFQAYLQDIWTQTTRLKQQGIPVTEAARMVDMTAHRPQFPNIQGPGVDIRAVTRIYEVLDMPGRRP